MNDHPTPTELLDRATTGLAPDVDRLVAGGIARGRRTQRRRRAGATLAAVAVFGVIGAAASLVPHPDGRSGSTPVADDTGTPTASATPSQAPSASASPSLPPQTTTSAPATPASPPAGTTDRVTVTAQQVPSTVEELLGRQGAGPLRTGPAYGSVSELRRVIAHFSWRGTLASVVVEPFEGDAQQACEQSVGPHYTCTADAAGHPMLLWGPTTGDGVAAQGATVWRDGFEVSVLSYNAAEGKNAPPVFEQPPLTRDDLSLLASSDAWFS